MNKYPLIGGSICAVVLLVLASLTNVIGYQTIQASNHKIITTENNEKELVFQTIVDLANNKEIQRVILGYELIDKRLYDPGMRFSVFTPPVLTEKFLKRMYVMGVIFTKTINKSIIHYLIEQYQVNDKGIQKEISAVIEKNTLLKGELTQLASSKCDCENNSEVTPSYIPLIACAILGIFIILTIVIYGASLGINKFFYILHLNSGPHFYLYLFSDLLHVVFYALSEVALIIIILSETLMECIGCVPPYIP
jgi:hypothetical protein